MADGPADNLQEFPQQIQRMLDHYRLVDNPFGKAVNAKAFSRVAHRAHIASQIERLFRSTAAECLLIAPSEGGKQTLARQIIKQLGVGWRVAWVDGWEVLDSVDLLRELVGQLKLGHPIEGTPEEEAPRVAELIARKSEGGENCLLVVQYADQLTPETQQWLRSLGTRGGLPEMRLRQLWLAESAQPIDQADEEDQWTATTLDPMTDAEALEYLADRFAAAGRFESVPIEADEVARLNRMAGGWPGRLNRVTRDYLVATTKPALEWRPPAELLYGLIAVAVLVAAYVVVVRYAPTQPDAETAASSAPPDHGPATDQAGLDSGIEEPGDGGHPSGAETEPAATAASEEDEVAPVPDEESPEADTAMVDAESTLPDEEDAGMQDAGEQAELGATIDEPDAGSRQPPPESETAAQSAGEGDEVVPGSGEESADADTVTAEPAPPPPDDVDAGTQDSGGGSVYTIQLAGGRNRDNLAAIGNDLDVDLDTDIARTTLEGRPWYVLIAGRHDSAAQAREAIAALPPDVRSRSPWPRPLSDLEVLESATPMIRVPPDPSAERAVTGEQDGEDAPAGEAPFTLQLIGVRDRGSLEELVSDLDDPERYEIVSTTFEGEPWYVLTHGRYETARAARSDIENLPPELEQYSPWPRRWSDLQ